MPGIDRERGQDRKDLALEEGVHRRRLVRRERRHVDQAYAARIEQREEPVVQAIALLHHEVTHRLLDGLAAGLQYKEIATKLEISTETVRVHVRRIYNKLQVGSRMEAIRKVYPKGM